MDFQKVKEEKEVVFQEEREKRAEGFQEVKEEKEVVVGGCLI